MKSYASITEKSVFTAPAHNQCQLEGRRGARKGSVFNTYSRNSSSTHVASPQKGGGEGEEGAYYTIFIKSKLLLVSFRMISAKETSSRTN